MIIICEYCGQYICPSACPNFEGYVAGLGSSIGNCSVCESRVYDEDGHQEKNGKILCAECAEELVSPELLEFLDCTDIEEFFDMLW